MLIFLLSCSATGTSTRVEPSFIEVTLGTSETGSQTSPLPFSSTTVTVPVSVQTLDRKGEPYPMDGTLHIKVRPGHLDQDDEVILEDGVWSGDVLFRNAFGPTRIWFLDEGEADGSRAASFAAGVSPVITYALPTIAEMQNNEDHETNNLDGEFAELRLDDRNVIVTARDSAGFWVSDISDTAGNYNSLYVYTFSRADDGLQPGVRLTLLTGNNQEYLGTTQLQFPTIEFESSAGYSVPGASEITSDNCADLTAMEKLEASRVVVNNPVIPANFLTDVELSDKYLIYNEWPMQVGECIVYVISNATAPDFNPTEHQGETLSSVSGMLKEYYGEWIVLVVDSSDIVTR